MMLVGWDLGRLRDGRDLKSILGMSRARHFWSEGKVVEGMCRDEASSVLRANI